MIFWIDAQLPPALAPWLTERFRMRAFSIKQLGYRDSKDREIFDAAREAAAVVITKDSDFLRLLESHEAPPQVLWITPGNASNSRMREVPERPFLTPSRFSKAAVCS